MSRITPDYSTPCSTDDFKEKFNHEYRGPGFYLSDEATLLVEAAPPNNPPPLETVWDVEQPEGTVLLCHVYNSNFYDLLFSALTSAPVRFDTRGKPRRPRART